MWVDMGREMRKEFTALNVAVLVLSLSSLAVFADDGGSQKSWFQRHFVRPAIDEALAECATPQQVCEMVDRYVGSYSESVNRWTDAEETWKRGWGDCEDFAVCIEQLCHRIGFDVQVHLFYPTQPGEEGHAVAVGNWNGQLWMSSLGSFKPVASMDDVRREAARVIGCKPAKMWSVVLAHDDVQRALKHNNALSTARVEE